MPAKKPFVFVSRNSLARSGSGTKTQERRHKRETLEQKTARTDAIAALLTRAYPELKVPLDHRSTFELLIAVILSAQCTDGAVNRVTPELFRRYPDAETMARASMPDIEQIIRPLGLFRAKAKSLQSCAKQIVKEFHGQVPGTMAELTRLAGVGRKTANVILGHAFGIPGMIVDTHCKRVARRLGLTRQLDPTKIERDLNLLLPPKQWTGFSHRLIIHGRRVCYARKPACSRCVLAELCPSSSAIDPS
jgi:endonuclease-3